VPIAGALPEKQARASIEKSAAYGEECALHNAVNRPRKFVRRQVCIDRDEQKCPERVIAVRRVPAVRSNP
jgi:hypothetical protein